MGTEGAAAEPPTTICKKFLEMVKKQGDKYAMQVERDGKVLKWTWNDYYNDVINFAKAMHVLGVKPMKSVNIIGHNQPEWPIAFVGGIFANCISSGVYPTNSAEACKY